MTKGYVGRVLHVDLTNDIINVEQPGEDFYRFYMGGSLMGLYYVLHNTPPGVDPLAPENTIVFTTSVITGAPISGQSRLTVTAKSPLTDCIGDSQSGGFFPAELKFAEFDAIVVKGRAKHPVYLWLQDGEAELRPAEHLWGKHTGEVENLLKKELVNNKIQILQIGPAGENLVRFAAIMSMSNRANGRTGMGAVMGSKNLKAIAVQGKKKPNLADKEKVLEIAKWGSDHFEDSDIYGLGLLGTAGITGSQNKGGGLPTRNWDSGVFEGTDAISGEEMTNKILQKRDTCYACTVRCKRIVEVKEDPYQVDPKYGGPEYETLAVFGSYCDVDDLEAIAYANQLCNMYGMDTISCGATIAWAMDCIEQGIINKEELDLQFGNAESMVRLTEMIAKREGIGDLLAEGSARAAAKIGRRAMDLVVAVKNQELPAHMPQKKRSLALIYAVNPFGADHQSSEHDLSYKYYSDQMEKIGLTEPQPDGVLNEEIVRYALITQYVYSCMDSLNVCQFVFGPAWQLYDLEQLAETVCAVTGWKVSVEELLLIGERRLNMQRSFNAREGIGRDADVLPKKLEKALIGGPSDGLNIPFDEVEKAKDWYYAMAGWDVKTGLPTKAKLDEIGLGWVTDLIS